MTSLFFQLRKILPAVILPVGFTLLLLTLALILRRNRTPRSQKWATALTAIGALVLLLSSLPPVAHTLANQLENQFPRLQPAQCPTAEAILVLGGAYSHTTQWNEAVDRFESGIQLFQHQKAPVLLFTATDHPDFNEGAMLREAAIEHGVPPDAVQLTPPASTTATEALSVQRTRFRRVILVTSAFHMPRAALLFRRAGIDIVPFPTDYRGEPVSWRLDRLFPAANALFLTETILREIYANALYRVAP